MTIKTLTHFEVSATMQDNFVVRGFCLSGNPPQLEYMETLCIFEDLTDESMYTEIRTRDIARLQVRPVISDRQEEPAQ